MEKCGTCKNQPMWGCNLFGCDDGQTCFIICPECGKEGFSPAPEQFNPDMELAALLTEARKKWKVKS